MYQQDYWKTFEQTGSVADYLHYINCARDELAVGIAEDAADRAAMRAAIASAAISAGMPVSMSAGGVAGTPIALGTTPAVEDALVTGLDDREQKNRRKMDENP